MIVGAHSVREEAESVPCPGIAAMTLVALNDAVNKPNKYCRVVNRGHEAQHLKSHRSRQRPRKNVLDRMNIVGRQGNSLPILMVPLMYPVPLGLVQEQMGQIEQDILDNKEKGELPDELKAGRPLFGSKLVRKRGHDADVYHDGGDHQEIYENSLEAFGPK